MYKRILFLSFAVIVISVSLVLLLRSKNQVDQSFSAVDIVAKDAIVFVENIDYQYFRTDFRDNHQIWNTLGGHEFSFFDRQRLIFLGQVIERISGLIGNEKDLDLSISLHLTGRDKISPVFYFNIDQAVTGDDISNTLLDLYADGKVKQARNYDGIELWELDAATEDSIGSLSFAIINGLLIISDTSLLTEGAIRTLKVGSGLSETTGFKDLREVAGKYVHGNLYLNYELLPHLISKFYDRKALPRNSSHPFGEMATYDINFDSERLVLNGMAVSADSSKGLLHIFRGQESVKTEAIEYIPSSASEFKLFGISNPDRFYDGLIHQLKLFGQYTDFKQEADRQASVIGESILSMIISVIDDEIAWYKMDVDGNGGYRDIVLFELSSYSEASQKLVDAWRKLLNHSGESTFEYSSKYFLDDQSSFDVYTFPDNYYSQTILKDFFKKHFAFYENYLITSNTKEAIYRTIYYNVLHKTLKNESDFKQVNDLISTRSNITIYINTSDYFNSTRKLYTDDVLDDTDIITSTLDKLPVVLIQFSIEDERFYSNVAMKYSDGFNDNTKTVWESLLDTIVAMKPALVTNHYTKENEILVQDANHTLYLLNSTGRILWNARLEGEIKSQIFQVDYYKNGKLQYLFNTAEELHLIDRNGNYVERYPVKLRSDATNGMALFDYDKRNDYRIFIAGSDKNVYVYNLEGNLVTGWEFEKTEGIVSQPVQHFRVKMRDYIVFKDNIRVYILNRRGLERVALKEQFTVSENNSFHLDMNVIQDNPILVTSDAKGTVRSIDLSGNVTKRFEFEAEPDHFFLYEDLDNDGIAEYIFADNNFISAVKTDGKKLFSFKIKSDISKVPDIYHFSSADIKIGSFDNIENEIYLINADGSLYEGFPLTGHGRFTIGYFTGFNSRFNLLVGNNDNFLYNYSID